MLTSEALKRYAIKTCQVDKIGIANIERFKDAPADMSPLSIMPTAKSVIVIARRILRGCHPRADTVGAGELQPAARGCGHAGT